MPETKIDPDVAVKRSQHIQANWGDMPGMSQDMNQSAHHLALVEAARGLAEVYAGHAAIRSTMPKEPLLTLEALLPTKEV